MRFFGVKVFPMQLMYASQMLRPVTAEILSQLAGLKSLRLHFRSTTDAASTDPWGYTGGYSGTEHFASDLQGNQTRILHYILPKSHR